VVVGGLKSHSCKVKASSGALTTSTAHHLEAVESSANDTGAAGLAGEAERREVLVGINKAILLLGWRHGRIRPHSAMAALRLILLVYLLCQIRARPWIQVDVQEYHKHSKSWWF
jgi:hypothetical protein